MRGLAATIVATGLVLISLAGRSWAGGGVSPADEARIARAMPARAPARPARPRKVLVYSDCTGFRHSCIPVAARAFQIMGKKTGAFEAVVSDDLANFEADRLNTFDAVLLNNTTGELLIASKQGHPGSQALRRRKDLVRFVAGGKGLMGIHAACDCSYKWAEYGQMIGGYFSGHPWNGRVSVKIDDPGHPLNAAFRGMGFAVTDEIYQFNRGIYSRSRQRVLLSLDMTKTPNKGSRPDGDYAISWIKEYGKGRVFYCALGHREDIYWEPAVLAHYLAGLQYVLGDLRADATPSARAGGPKPFVPPGPEPPGAEPASRPAVAAEADLTPWQAEPDAEAAQAAETTFEGLYGKEFKRAAATPDRADDVALAGELLGAVKIAAAQPALTELLCQRAYDLAWRVPEGQHAAAAAMEMLAHLAQKFPGRRMAALEKLLTIRFRQFNNAKGAERAAAGQAVMGTLLAMVDADAAGGDYDGAVRSCQRAIAVGKVIQSPACDRIEAQAKYLAARGRAEAQIKVLAGRLKSTPDDQAIRDKLILLYVMEIDAPAEAAGLLNAGCSQVVRTYVPLACMAPGEVPAEACLELGDWYRALAGQASACGKGRMLLRAQACYQRFLAEHPANDLSRTKAKLALQRVADELADAYCP